MAVSNRLIMKIKLIMLLKSGLINLIFTTKGEVIMEKRKLTFKNRLIAFVIMPLWAAFLTSLAESLIKRTLLNVDTMITIFILALIVYVCYPFFSEEKFEAIFVRDSHLSFDCKIRRHKSFFIEQTLLWLFVGTWTGIEAVILF
jgi:cation transport ATPase